MGYTILRCTAGHREGANVYHTAPPVKIPGTDILAWDMYGPDSAVSQKALVVDGSMPPNYEGEPFNVTLAYAMPAGTTGTWQAILRMFTVPANDAAAAYLGYWSQPLLGGGWSPNFSISPLPYTADLIPYSVTRLTTRAETDPLGINTGGVRANEKFRLYCDLFRFPRAQAYVIGVAMTVSG